MIYEGDRMEYVVILVLIGFILYFYIRHYIPSLKRRDIKTIKGEIGEVQVNRALSALNVQDYHLISNIIIKKPDGSSSQIDHLVVSKYGIFVIETKNYSGVIIGSENDYKWQHIFNKFSKFKFLNPIIQNKGHIEALKQILPGYADNIYRSIIVFTGNANIDNLYTKTPVIPIERLLQTIQHEIYSILSENEVSNIYTILSSTKYVNSLSEEEHINYVKGLGYDNEYTTTSSKMKTKNKEQKRIIIISTIFFIYIVSLISNNIQTTRNSNIRKPGSVNNNQSFSIPTTTPKPISPINDVVLPFNTQQNNNVIDVIQATPKLSDTTSIEILQEIPEPDISPTIDSKIDIKQFSLTLNSSNGYTLKFSLENNSEYIYKLRENSQIVVYLDNGDIIIYDMFGARKAYNDQELIKPGQKINYIPFEINDLKANITSIALINNDLEDSENLGKVIQKNYIVMLKEESTSIPIPTSDLSNKITFSNLLLTNDLNGSNVLSFSVVNKSEYIFRLKEDTQIIITYEDDKKEKYDVFGERLSYSISQMLKPGASANFKPFELSDDNSNIKQIELLNSDLIDNNDNSIIIFENYTITWNKQ